MNKKDSSSGLLAELSREIESNNSSIVTDAGCITPDKTVNNQLMIRELLAVDFRSSRIPREILDRKRDRRQPCGDLEYSVRTMIRELQLDTKPSEIDMTETDRYLYLIIRILQNAVAQGNVETAFAARAGLMNGLLRVRNQLDTPDRSIRDNYLRASVKYLETCYLYISVKNMIDISNGNMSIKRRQLSNEYNKLEDSKDSMVMIIKESPGLVEQLRDILGQTYLGSHYMWDERTLELYEMMVRMRIAESGLRFKGFQIETEEKRLAFLTETASKLEDIVSMIPVPEDPDILEKITGLIDDVINRAEQIDKDYDDMGRLMDSFKQRMNAIGERSRQRAASYNRNTDKDQ